MNPPANTGDLGSSLGQEGPLEEEMATYSSVLAWRIPPTEEPGGPQSTGSQSQTRLKRLSMHTHAWVVIKEKYCSHASNIFKKALYPVLTLPILSMNMACSPKSYFSWNLFQKPRLDSSSGDSFPMPSSSHMLFICSYSSLYHFLGPDSFDLCSLIPLLRFCFIQETWGLLPRAKIIALDSKRARERLKTYKRYF